MTSDDHDTDRAGTADAGSEWLMFDPGTGELVDLPADHPARAAIEQSTPVVLDDAEVTDEFDDELAYDKAVDAASWTWVMTKDDPPRIDEAIELAYDKAVDAASWTWVATKDEQARIDEAIRYAGPALAGRSPLQVLDFADEVDEERAFESLELAAQGDLSGVCDYDALDESAARAGLSDTHPLVVQAHSEIHALERDLADDRGASSATEIDQQWWHDRDHDTPAHSTGTGTDTGTDVGSEHDDGWS